VCLQSEELSDAIEQIALVTVHTRALCFFIQPFADGFERKRRSINEGDRRFIEVKGRAHHGPISLSANEYSTARRLGGSYWLYVVFNCASSPEVLAIQDPARLNWKALSRIEQYQVGLSDLLRTARRI